MEQHHDWYAKKRRDLARSTCSPLKGVAQDARAAKRNANRRQRRAHKALLVEAHKNPCLCCEEVDHCPRCDLETSHIEMQKSRPKAAQWYFYNHCYEMRWEWDKFSQILRWADSRRAELSIVEMKAEILALGKSPAHSHAIFHLLQFYFDDKFASAPKTSLASLKAMFLDHGVKWQNKPRSQLTEIAYRICIHGHFHAANQWSADLCVDLEVLRVNAVSLCSLSRLRGATTHMKDLDSNWRFDEHQERYWTYESAYRPLNGIQDIKAWANETQRLFDAMWGLDFLETPQGRWIIGELIKSAIPRIK